ncbi:hypothetical protein ACJX0J_007894 [Zea mays]
MKWGFYKFTPILNTLNRNYNYFNRDIPIERNTHTHSYKIQKSRQACLTCLVILHGQILFQPRPRLGNANQTFISSLEDNGCKDIYSRVFLGGVGPKHATYIMLPPSYILYFIKKI